MGTEYYIVKPSQKQLFYLGRRITTFDGIPNWCHTQKPAYAKWECMSEVVHDLWENNDYFFEDDMRYGQITELCYAIYNFCDAEVYLDCDISDNTEWGDYEEVYSVHDFFVNDEELLADIVINNIPQEHWVTKDHIIDEKQTLLNILKKVQYNKTTS